MLNVWYFFTFDGILSKFWFSLDLSYFVYDCCCVSCTRIPVCFSFLNIFPSCTLLESCFYFFFFPPLSPCVSVWFFPPWIILFSFCIPLQSLLSAKQTKKIKQHRKACVGEGHGRKESCTTQTWDTIIIFTINPVTFTKACKHNN